MANTLIRWPSSGGCEAEAVASAVARARLVVRCRAELAPDLKLEVDGKCVMVRRAGQVVARVSGNACAVWLAADDSPALLTGRFRSDDKHWDQAKRLIQRSRVGRKARQREHPIEEFRRVKLETPDAASAHLVTLPPANASPRQLGEMIVDSRRLRHERVRAFGLPVELILRHDQLRVERLRLEPIRKNGLAPELPFTYQFENRRLTGALRLGSVKEPMAMALYGDPAEWVTHLRPWHLALVGAAELNCDPRGERELGSFSLHGEDGVPVWTPPATWVPDEPTSEWSARHVPGHFRRLPRGTASDMARRNARAIGVELPWTGLTWVRPHLNGLPPDTVLTFTWTPRLARG